MKVVITGPGSCGKTSLIQEFKKRGFKIIPDHPREVLEERKNFIPIKPEIEYRQNLILEKQIKKESEISSSDEIVFLEYGMIDIQVYSEYLTGESIKIKKELLKNYDIIFILECLPWINDGIRVESNEENTYKIREMMFEKYMNYGFNPISVPILPVKERADFILEEIKKNQSFC